MTDVHSTAVVDPAATLGANVVVGPFCVIGPKVVLGDSVRLHPHVVITGDTRIGAGCEIFPFASIGLAPQDKKFRGEATRLEIGERNVIREYVTMNPGTEGGGGLTRVGSDCLFMVSAHVAHDCHIGNHVIFANGIALAGHCTVGDFAILGGLSAIHQYVRIGQHAFLGGVSGLETDLIPYGLALGNRAHLSGLNITGLKRRGFGRDQIHDLRKAYRALFAQQGTLAERADEVARSFDGNSAVAEIVAFVKAPTERSICVPKSISAND